MLIRIYHNFVEIFFWLSVTILLGGMISFGAIAAPVIFRDCEKLSVSSPFLPDRPNSPATKQIPGEIFGDILNVFAIVGYYAGGVLLVTWLLRMWGLSAWRRWTGLSLILALGIFMGYFALLTQHIHQARQEWRQAADQGGPAATQEKRITFDALHQQSELVAKVELFVLLGILMVGINVKPRSDSKHESQS